MNSQPSFTFLEEEKKRKRANSIHVFEPPALPKKKKNKLQAKVKDPTSEAD